MERLTGHAELQELLGAYALDAVEPDEAELLERHLQVCPRCRTELTEHREVAALLGNAGASAPEGVWDRIIASLEEPPPALQLTRLTDLPRPEGAFLPGADAAVTPQTPPPIHARAIGEPGAQAAIMPIGQRRRRSVPIRILAAAAAAIVVAGLGIAVGRLGRRAPSSSQLAAPAQLWHFANADRLARRTTLASSDQLYKVDAIIAADGTTHLGPGMPSLPSTETYQVWGIVDGQRVSLAVLGTTATYAIFTTPPKVSVLAMTIEAQGGVVSSTKPPILAGVVPT